MIDHIGIDVSDINLSQRFYTASLKALGIETLVHVTAEQTGGRAYIGMGLAAAAKPVFWFGDGPAPISSVHVAFTALDRSSVDRFYHDALAAGGTCNGPPGIREIYHPNYYGAFVRDPDGHNIEAVCHIPLES